VTRRLRIDDMTELAVPEQPVLSPDGTQLVYVLRTTDKKADRTVRTLWRTPASGGTPEQLTRGDADMAPV
jgi:Tol biopolymer transport system component